MREMVEFLQANPEQYFMITGRDGRIKRCPFMFCFEKGGRLWFSMDNTNKIKDNMLLNPQIELSVQGSSCTWIYFTGKAVFENNMEIKEACLNNPVIKVAYGEATNPIFEVFYLESPHGTIIDFSGNPTYKF